MVVASPTKKSKKIINSLIKICIWSECDNYDKKSFVPVWICDFILVLYFGLYFRTEIVSF